MKILIADDDFTSRTILQAALFNWGYDVVSTCDGEEAWAAFQDTDPPQLAVLDWMMPGLDGPTLCRKLREQERKDSLYLIMLTSKDKSGDVVKGLEAGADDYIAKPYDNEELRARVYVGRRMIKLQNELREQEKLQGVLELAGAVCHELNQPLQSVLGSSELLLTTMKSEDSKYESMQNIKMGIERIGELTGKIMNITRYQTKPYLNAGEIIDIEEASR